MHCNVINIRESLHLIVRALIRTSVSDNTGSLGSPVLLSGNRIFVVVREDGA